MTSATPSLRRASQRAATVARHALPLVVLWLIDGSIHAYLVLAIFDLGLSYGGQQLRLHPGASTRHALELAEGWVEWVSAWAQMPLMMALVGALFVFSAALPMVPLMMAGWWPEFRDALGADWPWLLGSAAAMSVAAAWQFDDLLHEQRQDSAFLRAAEMGAVEALSLLGVFLLVLLPLLALGVNVLLLWVLAVLFASLLVARDFGLSLAPRRY